MPTAAPTPGKRGWDPLVRLTHWTIALAVVVNGLFLRDGTVVHVWIGYAALSALILRLLWGLIAPGPAHLADMPLAPSRAFAHLRDLMAGRWHDRPGHTPLGALMAMTIWIVLGITALTGLSLEADPFPGDETHRAWSGYRYDNHDDEYEEEDEHRDRTEGSDFAEELHETAATALLILAALHVAGVGLESRLSGVNLAKGMIRSKSERTRR